MTFNVPGHVHFRQMHDEVVILDGRKERFLALNRTAAKIWGVLVEGGSTEDAVEALINEFDVKREAAQQDVNALLGKLLERQLLEPKR